MAFDPCCATARRITGDRAVAEELAAEAFTRAWMRWPWLRLQGSPVGWVVRVTVNLALDHVRRGPAPAVVTPDDYIALDDAVVVRLTLVEALGRLSTRQRQALSLHYLAGLEEAEVATAMGISAGSVKTHLHRGRARLRQLLTGDGHPLEARLAPDPMTPAPLTPDRRAILDRVMAEGNRRRQTRLVGGGAALILVIGLVAATLTVAGDTDRGRQTLAAGGGTPSTAPVTAVPAR